MQTLKNPLGFIDESQSLHERYGVVLFCSDRCVNCMVELEADTHKILFIKGGIRVQGISYKTLLAYECPDCVRRENPDAIVKNIQIILSEFVYILVL